MIMTMIMKEKQRNIERKKRKKALYLVHFSLGNKGSIHTPIVEHFHCNGRESIGSISKHSAIVAVIAITVVAVAIVTFFVAYSKLFKKLPRLARI